MGLYSSPESVALVQCAVNSSYCSKLILFWFRCTRTLNSQVTSLTLSKISYCCYLRQYNLHTHSVWDTICDAGSSLGLENLLLILPRIPYSCQRTTPPPPGFELLNEDLRSSGLELVKNTENPRMSPSPQWKFGQDLGLWILGCQEYPPPTNKNLVRTWEFECWSIS